MLNSFHKIKSNTTLIKGGLFSIYSIINRGFSFLFLLILANYITPSEYGFLSLFNTFLMLVGYFIAFSTEGYISISYFKEKKEGVTKSLSCIIFNSLIVSLLFLIILLLYGNVLAELLHLPLSVLYMSIIICFFTLVVNVYLDLFRVQEKIQQYGVISITNASSNFILSLVLIVVLSMGWTGRVYAQMLCYAVLGSIALFSFLKNGLVKKIDWKHWKSMIIWGMPLIPHLATNFIRQGCDRYIINYCYSIDEVGYFSFALNLANIIVMIGGGFNQSNAVDICRILGDKEMSIRDKERHLMNQKSTLFRIYTLSALIIVILVSFFVPIIFPKYEQSVFYFILLAVYAYFFCIYLLYTNFLFFYEKTKSIMYVTFSCSFLHLSLSLLLTNLSLYVTCFIYCFSQALIAYLIRNKASKVMRDNNFMEFC